MPSPSRTLQMMQTLIDGEYSLLSYSLSIIDESSLHAETFNIFNHAKPIGIAPGFNKNGKVVALAIADDQNCLIVELPAPRNRRTSVGSSRMAAPLIRNTEGLQALEASVLLRNAGKLYAFNAGPLAMALYTEFELHIANAVDIQSAVPGCDRQPSTVVKAILGNSLPVKENNIQRIFRQDIYEPRKDRDLGIPANELSQRAWISQFLVNHADGAETFDKVSLIDTTKLNSVQMTMISKIGNDALRLDQTRPTSTTHEFVLDASNPNQEAKLSSLSYKTKFHSNQKVKMTIQTASGGSYVTPAQIGIVSGKSGSLNADRDLQAKTVTIVRSIGKDGPTRAESQRAATVLKILQGSSSLLDRSPWITAIWFPEEGKPLSWPKHFSEESPDPQIPSPSLPHEKKPVQIQAVEIELNSSQQEAVNTMLSIDNEHHITIVQGPPGTGKTSVIAAFVQLAIMMGNKGIWLVAQSNVAVKNIAEKLLKVGFTDWVLLVSKDFHFEWHEHIYSGISQNIIRSDFFMRCPHSNYRHAHVMLCTLSMLSNPNITKFTSHNPVKTLVVDEASQIEIGNYISVFSKYSTLRKACFIGDDQQLPPFGQEDLQDLQSIFEVAHLRPNALFLDTQYRMPPQIGQIISEAVYNSKLGSNPLHPITSSTKACHFVDAAGTEQRQGDSYKNMAELSAVLALAQKLQEQGKAYQIITPYEGQRNSIEQQMKETEGLDWKNKCFNVDSFQGNEQDFIIISLVRSRELGFLDNFRRTNVMLTRCKRGQFIVSSKSFLTNKGASTLVGTLLEKIGPDAWLDMKDVEAGNF